MLIFVVNTQCQHDQVSEQLDIDHPSPIGTDISTTRQSFTYQLTYV